jgi:hypothetical protein
MFVRWERRDLESGRAGRCLREAILMKNHKKEGVMQEQVVAPLAAIEERFLTAKEVGIRGFHRGLFWTLVDKKLKALNMENLPRSMIEAEISKRVPRPATNEWSLWAVTCVPRYEE